jgi:predicted nucleic acid-binding protein
MMRILFDTDVIIEHLRGNQSVRDTLNNLSDKNIIYAYTPVTEAEIYHGLRANEEEVVEATLGLFQCLDITRTIGRRAGNYLQQYAKSHHMDVADALIAACAAENGYSLCTFSWKHYPMNDIKKYKINR